MPSFIAAVDGNKILQKKQKASELGLTIGSYAITEDMKPSDNEFNPFLNGFEAFCKENANTQCDTLLFTGGHGNHGKRGGSIQLNNLGQDQLAQITQVARKHQVTFNHVIADCCMATSGLEQLNSLTANGGKLVGERTTSTAHWAHDHIVKNIESATNSQDLMQSALEANIANCHAPSVITNNNNQCTLEVTTDSEVMGNLYDKYEHILGRTPTEEEFIFVLGGDFDMLVTDLESTPSHLTITAHEDRQALIASSRVELKKEAPQSTATATQANANLTAEQIAEKQRVLMGKTRSPHLSPIEVAKHQQALMGKVREKTIIDTQKERFKDLTSEDKQEQDTEEEKQLEKQRIDKLEVDEQKQIQEDFKLALKLATEEVTEKKTSSEEPSPDEDEKPRGPGASN